VYECTRDAGVMWVSGTLTILFNANAKDVSCRRTPYYNIRTASTRSVENGTFEGWDLDGSNRGDRDANVRSTASYRYPHDTCRIRRYKSYGDKTLALYHGRGPISRQSHGRGRCHRRRHYRRRWDAASAGRRRQDRGPSG